jgi:hypothetical protein
MGFNLDSMIGKHKDYARNYQFYAKIAASPVTFDENHSYLVTSTSLPAHTIDVLSTKWQGMEYKVAGTHTFAEFTLTFRSDTAQDIRRKFAQWQTKIHNPLTNEHGMPGNSGGYFGTISLSQIDGKGTPIMTYEMVGAWPSAIAEVGLDYGTKEFSTFAVTFNYQYFKVDDVFGGQKATPVKLS